MTIQPSFLTGLRSASVHPISIASADGEFPMLRRGLAPPRSTKKAWLQLSASSDGVLDWEEGPPGIPGMSKRRRGIGTQIIEGTQNVSFDRLEPSMITSFLSSQDAHFTPARGLRKHKPNVGLANAKLPDSGNALLFIHGTFSNGKNVLKSLQDTEHGLAFLRDASKKYSGNIFSFDHPTISVGPLLNAIDLQRAIGKSQAKIDIITHSRGGLVTRWWCEAFDPQLDRCKNAILVGSPLAGTGLAAPPNIRKTLKLLTNFGNALSGITGVATAVIPVLGIVNTLLRVITSVTSLAASTPIADSIMAMIPGLFAQSRVGNNPELLRLHESNGTIDRYASVRSDYQSEDPGWRFWKYFSKGVIVDSAADMIFDGSNDLVVDTESMAYLSKTSVIPPKRTFDFEKTDLVHHLNYFERLDTTDFFRKILNV